MKSSDDEAESLPLPVSNYHFVDDNYEPVSFSVLPIQWDEDERIGGEKVRVFLHGSADNGLQMIFMHVIAWKFELSNEGPEILVLSKDNTWIKLQKPKKSFEDIVRSVLVTVHSLHFLMRKPEASGETLWAHIFKLFSLHEEKPFQIDLEDHLCLISEACRRNAALAKSKLLGEFVNKNPKKRKKPDEDSKAKTVSKFVVNKKDAVVDVSEEHESSESRDIYDDVCAFCDEGGDLLCCEGRCMRSFHATMKAATAANSNCDSLGLTENEVNAIPNFLCRNCEYKQHQCFICGMLGSSDTSSGAAQVFGCASATCGRFYHPHCVSKLLHQDNKDSVEALEKKIVEGRSFMCPIHKCCICKQGENKKDPDLQFAVCRRCPKSYHRKCLPRKIAFEENKKEGIVIRAWTDVLSDRILMYCLEHEMDERIGTPTRDHIKFPNVEEKKNVTEKRKASVEEKKSHTSSNSSRDSRKIELKMRIPASEEHNHGTTACETLEQNAKPSSAVKVRGNKDMGEHCSQPNIPVRVHVNDASKKELKSPVDRENKSLQKPGKKETTKTVPNKSEEVEAMTKILSSSLPQLDADTERSLMDLMEDAASSINPDDIRGKDGVPSTHTSSLKDIVNGTVTMEKLESLAQEVRTASHIPENGGCIEDAKAVCKPELLSQIYNWKIVNKLHCYVQEGDTIVDICCGDNDFGLLMKNKLEEMGRKCLYENYDIVRDKNNINSEKRDWMTVQLEDLPTGTKLIMGLNISSGVEAALANKFIDKALEFRPKLLLLILPQEAQRLGENIPPYCLIWEDSHLLSGKSFYSSGYVNTNEKQTEQSNVMPHVLYLWSRIDWSSTHKYIAERYCHISTQQELVEKSAEHTIANHPTRDHDNYDTKLNPTNEFLGHESHKSSEHRNTKSEKKHGGEEVETTRECKSEIWPHPEYGGHNHRNFGNCVPASPMQSGTAYEGKRSRTLEDEFTRHNMSTAEHGTGRYDGETSSFHSRQHINESEEKPKNESNMWSGIADGGKRARTLDEKFRRHTMHADEHRIDHYAQTISVSNRQQINGNEGKPRKETNIQSPISIHEQKDSYSSGSNHPAGHNAGHNLMGSITLSLPSSRHRNSASEPSYPINALGMQYLPTDELKSRRSSFYDAPELPGHPGVPMGFAPGPNEAYSLHHSAGWIDE